MHSLSPLTNVINVHNCIYILIAVFTMHHNVVV